jgi:hypothetical protein
MNGVLEICLDSGMLLFSHELVPNFGLSGRRGDPHQQGGFLYALYMSSISLMSTALECVGGGGEAGVGGEGEGLQWYSQGDVVWHFLDISSGNGSGNGSCNGSGKGSDAGVGLGPDTSSSRDRSRRILTVISTSRHLSSSSAQAIACKISEVREIHLKCSLVRKEGI